MPFPFAGMMLTEANWGALGSAYDLLSQLGSSYLLCPYSVNLGQSGEAGLAEGTALGAFLKAALWG